MIKVDVLNNGKVKISVDVPMDERKNKFLNL